MSALRVVGVVLAVTGGLLTVGSAADVIAARGNPLTNITVLRNVELVMKAGNNVT